MSQPTRTGKGPEFEPEYHLERFPDWAPRLNKYIIEVRDHKFEPGVHDCCTFVAGAIQAMTGVDVMPEYRGQYTTLEEGEAALAQLGQGKLYRTITRKLGRSIRGVFGAKGDVAFYQGCCGIVLGRLAMFIGEEGYVYAPISRLQRVWRV